MSYPKSINHSQAIKLIETQVSAWRLQVESVQIHDAASRVLAQDVIAPFPVPEYDCSRMDGYAVNIAEAQRINLEMKSEYELNLGEPIHATAQNKLGLCGESAIPVMTGAVLPSDADGILIKEQSRRVGNKIYFEKLPKKHEFFRFIGSDIKPEQVIIKAHQRLNAAHLGLLASLGLTVVSVIKRPRVALIVTGDEIVKPGQTCQMGQMYDANSDMLRQLLEDMGCDVELLIPLADEKNQIIARFKQLKLQDFDAIVTVGGVSMGDKDWIPEVLYELGEIVFHKVRIKPGFPVIFGRLGHALFFGLPGNPVSAYTTMCQYVFSAVKSINQQPIHKQLWRAELLHEYEKSHFRREFLRGFFDVGANGHIQVRVCGNQNSSRIESLAESNCFIVLDESHNDLKGGDRVNIQPFSQFTV